MGELGDSEILHFRQYYSKPPPSHFPSACWAPWLWSTSSDIKELAQEAWDQNTFLEYVVFCRANSTTPSHPEPHNCIIFMIENMFKTVQKCKVLRVSEDVLAHLEKQETREEFFLKPMGKDKSIMWGSDVERTDMFRHSLASGTSEDKMADLVKVFMFLDQVP